MATQSNKEVFVGGFKKLLNEKWQADVRLKAGDSDESAAILAHKLFLVARSEVFKKILESDEFKGSGKLVETVTLSEMKHEEVEALVEFIYSVDGSISSESLKKHVRSLFLAADKYEIPHLRDLCRKELRSSLRPSNALSILELAQIPFDKALNDAAFTYVVNSMSVIASGDEFKLFVVNHPNLSVEIMKASIARAARSEVFKKMLEPDDIKASAKLETITLPEMKHEELENFVDFIYSVGGSSSSASLKKHARSLCLAADKYAIPHLRDLCRTEIVSSLNSSNASPNPF